MWNVVEMLQLLGDTEDPAKLDAVRWIMIPEIFGECQKDLEGSQKKFRAPGNKKENPESKDPVATSGEGH